VKAKILYTLFFLILCNLFAASGLARNPSRKIIRGAVAAVFWNKHLLVRTEKKKFVVLKMQISPQNYLPEKALREMRSFAVEPPEDCVIKAVQIRYSWRLAGCGNEYPPVPSPSAIADYPFVNFIRPAYRNELDEIGDETQFACYAVDLSRSKPAYQERIVKGIVLGSDRQPLPSFPVSIGFTGEKLRNLYVLTDEEGKFSLPVFEQFSYWIKPGLTNIEGQREYRAVNIPKQKMIPFLTLKLEFEDSGR
jgi:hypothetical protein